MNFLILFKLLNFFIFFMLLCVGCPAESLKIASWNILSQAPYEYYAFKNIKNRASLIWKQDNRISKIVEYLQKLINQHKVDVICLQEVNLTDVEEFGPIFNFFEQTGYVVCVFEATRETEKINQTTLVAYNKKKFAANKVDSLSHYLFVDHESGKGCTAARLVFINHELGPQINVVSVHLPFKAQGMSLQRESLKDLLLDKNTVPSGLITMLCGDFNWATTSYYYQYDVKLSADYSRFPVYMEKAYEDLVKTLQTYPAVWQDAARIKKNQSDPTVLQSWGTLETVDYIWYGVPPRNNNLICTCTSFKQIPVFNIDHVDTYFDALVKHSFPLSYKDIIEASKNNNIERVQVLQLLESKMVLSYNNNTLKNFKPYRDFPSDHAILIAAFEIDVSDTLT